MAGSSGLQVYIGATSADLAKGLEDAKRQIEGWSREATRSLAQSGAGAKAAGASFGSLGDTVKALARDQRSEARAAGFFVQELAQIVPIAGDAKAALTGLGASVVGGVGLISGLGAALAIIGYIASAFREAEAEAKKLTEESKRIGDALAEAQEKQAVAMARVLGGPVKEAEAQREAELAKQRRAIGQLGDAIAAKEKELADKRGGVVVFLPGIRNLETEISNLRGKLDAAYAGLSTIAVATEEKVTEAVRREAENRKKIREDELAAARKAYELRLEEARFRASRGAAYGKSEDENLLTPESGNVLRDILRRAHAKDTSGEASVGAFMALESETGGFDPLNALRAAQKTQELYNQEVSKSVELSKQWGATLANVFAQFATGQITAKQTLATIIAGVIRQIGAHAAEAAAGAAASQAPIPIIGPALAITAMAEMFAAVIAMQGRVGTAARGYRVPEWVGAGGVATVLHPGEHVLPKEISREYEGGRGRRKGSGLTVNINGAADSRDVQRMLEEELPRVFRRLQRSGSL